MTNWFSDACDRENWRLLEDILRLFKESPVTVERLKTNQSPKQVKQLSKEAQCDGEYITAPAVTGKQGRKWPVLSGHFWPDNFFSCVHRQCWCKQCVAFICFLTRAPLGYSAERAPLGGGGAYSVPCLTPEPIGAARRARRRSKALTEKIPMRIKILLNGSRLRSRSGQRSEICVFGLLWMIYHRDRAINSRAFKLFQNASLQQDSTLEEYDA